MNAPAPVRKNQTQSQPHIQAVPDMPPFEDDDFEDPEQPSTPSNPASDLPTMGNPWPLEKIIAILSRKIPKTLLKTKKAGSTTLEFVPWYRVNRILDKYAPGWGWQIVSTQFTDDRIFLTGRLTIPTASGPVYRDATGTELLKQMVKDKEKNIMIPGEIAYGDPSSNAESMAFRRAAARFGFGLGLYDKDA